jgi:hypothetical protein
VTGEAKRACVFIAIASAALCGCTPKAETAADVIAAVARGKPEPLDALPEAPKPVLEAGDLAFGRDPFTPPKGSLVAGRSVPSESAPSLRLDPTRIRLIRTVQHNGSRYALISTRDNDLYRVTVGDVLAPRAIVRDVTEDELLLSINGVERKLSASP